MQASCSGRFSSSAGRGTDSGTSACSLAQSEHAYKLFISQRSVWHHRGVSVFLWLATLAYLGLFIASLVCSEWQLASLWANPLLGAPKDVLIRLGATATYKIQADNEWWRLISSIFLCAGTLHVWAVSSGLWTFGLFLSTVLSPWQLILVFALSGLAGVTMSANIAANFITSAASGPVFGFIGGACATLLLHWHVFVNRIASLAFMALVLALNLYMGATPFVDNSCNTIAFVAGALATLGLLLLNRRTIDGKGYEFMLRASCCCLLVVVLAVSVVGVLGLLIPTKSPAQGCCDDWVCIPSPQWDCNAARVQQTCVFTSFQNGTLVMYCPLGAGSMAVPDGLSDSSKLALCDSACSGAVSATPDPSTAPGS